MNGKLKSNLRKILILNRYFLLKACGCKMPTPVFIACQNRSGSTFLNRLFTGHPDCWTYTLGEHEEAMDHPDCPFWISSRQKFLERWKTTDCPKSKAALTKSWCSFVARNKKFGIFKIPHVLSKIESLSIALPNARFIVPVRHPCAQAASAIQTGNSEENLAIVADTLIDFLKNKKDRIPNLFLYRYEELVSNPQTMLAEIFKFMGADHSESIVQKCIDRVGVKPSSGKPDSQIPDWFKPRAETICQLMGYSMP